MIDAGTPNAGDPRSSRRSRRPNPPSPQPNVIFTAGARAARIRRARSWRRHAPAGVGFQPDYDTEGKHEALEFAAGNYGLLESALEYATDDDAAGGHDDRAAVVAATPITTTFEFVNEPSVIRYTTDGSKPTRRRRCGTRPARASRARSSTSRDDHDFKWLATDIKGNVSTGKQKFQIRRSRRR